MNRKQIIVILLTMIAVGVAITTLPLGDLFQPGGLERLLQPVRAHPLLPLFIIATFWLASALFISVWLCIVQTALLFPSMTALLLCMTGALSAAVLFYGIGRFMTGERLRLRIPPALLTRVSGISWGGMLLIRLVPILPFSLVNLACGSMRVPLHVFVVATVLGMLPGMFGVCIVGAQFIQLVQHPTPTAVAIFISIVVVVTIAVILWRRRSRRDGIDDRPQQSSHPAT